MALLCVLATVLGVAPEVAQAARTLARRPDLHTASLEHPALHEHAGLAGALTPATPGLALSCDIELPRSAVGSMANPACCAAACARMITHVLRHMPPCAGPVSPSAGVAGEVACKHSCVSCMQVTETEGAGVC